MAIYDYLKKLTHRFGRNDIEKKCEDTLENLRTHTIPAYESASTLFKIEKIKSKEALGFASEFKRIVKGAARADSMVDHILETLNNCTTVIAYISKKAPTLYSDQESNIGLTFEKATYIRLLAAIGFTNDFSRKFLNYLYVLETANADPEFSLKDNITPAEIKIVHDGFTNFCSAVQILSQSINVIEKKLEDLPDAIVSDSSESALAGVHGASKIDPLMLNNFTIPIDVSVKWNPIYWAAMFIADIQIASYNAAKEEVDLLQLRKLNLEKLYEKKPDTRLQKEIEHLSSRVAGLNYKLQKLESQYE